MKARNLKVQEIGDFYAKKTKPSIRLSGKWLLDAGIKPDQYVVVTNPKRGMLVIQIRES